MPGARSALRVDQRRLSSTLSAGVLSSVPFSSSPSSSSSVCLFFCGGLGVGEKPTRGELVRSTHRVAFYLLPAISFRDLSVSHCILWGWQQLMALSSPLCIIRLC